MTRLATLRRRRRSRWTDLPNRHHCCVVDACLPLPSPNALRVLRNPHADAHRVHVTFIVVCGQSLTRVLVIRVMDAAPASCFLSLLALAFPEHFLPAPCSILSPRTGYSTAFPLIHYGAFRPISALVMPLNAIGSRHYYGGIWTASWRYRFLPLPSLLSRASCCFSLPPIVNAVTYSRRLPASPQLQHPPTAPLRTYYYLHKTRANRSTLPDNQFHAGWFADVNLTALPAFERLY